MAKQLCIEYLSAASIVAWRSDRLLAFLCRSFLEYNHSAMKLT